MNRTPCDCSSCSAVLQFSNDRPNLSNFQTSTTSNRRFPASSISLSNCGLFGLGTTPTLINVFTGILPTVARDEFPNRVQLHLAVLICCGDSCVNCCLHRFPLCSPRAIASLPLGNSRTNRAGCLKCGFETNPGVPGFSFGTKWNQTGTGDSRKCLKRVVARDGLEPPTPAFSGPARTIVILLIPFGLSIFYALKTAILLEWNWNGFWNGRLHQSVHDSSLRLWNELLVEVQRRACSGMPHQGLGVLHIGLGFFQPGGI